MTSAELRRVRAELLSEAQLSPGLLTDLAGLERYIAESYHQRSFTELLQNADDAGAARASISIQGDTIFVANDGRPFNESDLTAICRSARSTKTRGSAIGYRGIGFKSIVEFAHVVHLLSGPFQNTFSKTRTRADVPSASDVPLVRVPHEMLPEEFADLEPTITRLRASDYSTIFVLRTHGAESLERELENFDFTSLLFLRSVKRVEVDARVQELVMLRRRVLLPGITEAELTSSTARGKWIVASDRDGAVACRLEAPEARLAAAESLVHAFLPTEELSGICAKVHGDFSTDPSRRRVVLDGATRDACKVSAQLFLDLLRREMLRKSDPCPYPPLLSSLTPTVDARIATFRRQSFATELMRAIVELGDQRFSDFVIQPRWLGPQDSAHVATHLGLQLVPAEAAESENLAGLLKALGAQELLLTQVLAATADGEISRAGRSALLAQTISRFNTGQFQPSEISDDWRLFYSDVGAVSLGELRRSATQLDQQFLAEVNDRGLSTQDIHRFLAAVIGKDRTQALLPVPFRALPEGAVSSADEKAVGREPNAPTHSSTRVNADGPISQREGLALKKWRAAEQQVLDVLNAQGFALANVSRQNLGADLKGVDATGQEVMVEVKSVDYVGQPITLTNNEVALAKSMGERYLLAVVHQTDKWLNLSMIPNPARELTFERVCKQWVWECTSYPNVPERFRVE